jgi:hypothetical protein
MRSIENLLKIIRIVTADEALAASAKVLGIEVNLLKSSS